MPFKSSKPLTVREVKSDQIGKLITVSGIAIRVTNVRPLLFVAAYTCDACGHEFYKSVFFNKLFLYLKKRANFYKKC